MGDEFTWNLMGGLAMVGVVVSLINNRTAILLGISVVVGVVVAMFIESLSRIRPEKGWNLAYQIITMSGSILSLLVLLGFYSICLLRNSDYIADNSMPDSWYLFSYFVIIVTGMNIVSIVQYMKTNLSEYNTLSMVLSTILFGFIMIEAIICSYFRTDGFTQ
jgi:hypothetical protein